jgi:hypothetical protein
MANPSRGGDAKPGIFLEEDRPVAGSNDADVVREVDTVKARLTKLTWALALLASMALTLGAGIRWC